MTNLALAIKPPAVINACTPRLPGLLGEVERELTASGGNPDIVVPTLCAYASASTQLMANVALPNGSVMPIGANVIASAGSGAGKSLTKSIVGNVMNQAIEACQPATDSDLSDPSDDSNVPPDFFVEDVSLFALIRHLNASPIAALFTDEAGMTLDLFRKDASKLAKLLDGSTFRYARGTRTRIKLQDYRCTMMLLFQPLAFAKLKPFLGGGLGGVGLENRFFFFQSPVTRPLQQSFKVGLTKEMTSKFERRIQQLIKTSTEVARGIRPRAVLSLSPAAQELLDKSHLEVCDQAERDKSLIFMQEHVTRHRERVLKLAAVLHVSEIGPHNEISADFIRAADQIGRVSLDNYRDMMWVQPNKPRSEQDADHVADVLCKHLQWQAGPCNLDMDELNMFSINIGLTKQRFQNALATLASRDLVRIYPEGRRRRLAVNLNALRDQRSKLVWSFLSRAWVPLSEQSKPIKFSP